MRLSPVVPGGLPSLSEPLGVLAVTPRIDAMSCRRRALLQLIEGDAKRLGECKLGYLPRTTLGADAGACGGIVRWGAGAAASHRKRLKAVFW